MIKISNALLALMFLGFAFLQVDDPDPMLWILIYGNMAVLSVLAMFRMRFRIWVLITVIVYMILAARLVPGAVDWFQSPDRSLLFDDLAKMQYPYIEETREFLGLIICLVVLAIQTFQARK